MGSWRRDLLRRHAFDLLTAPRVNDDAAENYFGAAATVRIGRCGELVRPMIEASSAWMARPSLGEAATSPVSGIVFGSSKNYGPRIIVPSLRGDGAWA